MITINKIVLLIFFVIYCTYNCFPQSPNIFNNNKLSIGFADRFYPKNSFSVLSNTNFISRKYNTAQHQLLIYATGYFVKNKLELLFSKSIYDIYNKNEHELKMNSSIQFGMNYYFRKMIKFQILPYLTTSLNIFEIGDNNNETISYGFGLNKSFDNYSIFASINTFLPTQKTEVILHDYWVDFGFRYHFRKFSE